MDGPVLVFFQLALGVPSHFSLYVTNKYIGFTQVFFKKYLEFDSKKKNKPVTLSMGLVLLSIIEDAIFSKACGKKYALMSLGPSSFKMGFTLLTKVVIFHMQIAIIKFEISRLEQPVRVIYWLCGWYFVSSLYDTCLYKMLE